MNRMDITEKIITVKVSKGITLGRRGQKSRPEQRVGHRRLAWAR